MNYTNTLSFPIMYVATVFLLGPMITCSLLLIAMKYGLYRSPP